jgi:Tol biopolymer transport system component
MLLHKRKGGASPFDSEDNLSARPMRIVAAPMIVPPNAAPAFGAPDFAINRISTGALGAEANGSSVLGAISPDGSKLVFASTATNLVAGDTNDAMDIFVKDLLTGNVTRIAPAIPEAGRFGSSHPVFSPDGTKVAFVSDFSNLGFTDINQTDDVFIKDLTTGTLTLVSSTSGGAAGNGPSGGLDPAFSPDGTKILFNSWASDLVAGDTNGAMDVFMKDLVSGVVTRISVDSTGAQGEAQSGEAHFSPDGTKVLFASRSTNLVPGKATPEYDLFVKDLATGAVTRVSETAGGAAGNGLSFEGVFSPDGTKVLFTSFATNLVSGDTNNHADLFIKDLITGAISRVSVNADGQQIVGLNGEARSAHFSPDGTEIVFSSGASNLTPGDTSFNDDSIADVFVKNLITGAVTRLSTTTAGVFGNSGSGAPAFLSDAGQVVFGSLASNLTAGDANNGADIFLATLGTKAVAYVENAQPMQVASFVNVADSDSGNYSGGSLNVAISTGSVAGDALILRTSNFAGHGIELSGIDVLLNGVAIGTLSTTATGFTVALNAQADDVAVKALAESAYFSSSSEDPGSGARTVSFTLIDGGGTANGGQDTTTFTRIVSVTPVDDAPVAVADAYSTNENDVLNVGAAAGVLANDTDVDGGPKLVASVQGLTFVVGSTISLSSGAELTLNADGSFTYDPNGAFDYLISPARAAATGAVNSSAIDSFTYSLNGDNATTVNVTLHGLDGVGDHLNGDNGANTIIDTVGANFFDLSQGGNDTASGLDGNDAFFFGPAFTAADQVDGGAGNNDQIGLQGDYTGANALVLGPNTIANIEAIVVLPGFSYDITMNDGNVPAGGLLKVQATLLPFGQGLTFNGLAEHDGSFMIFGGNGNDHFNGSSGDDGFYFGPGGFVPSSPFGNDTVNGGPGTNDQLGLDGDYGSAGSPLVLSGATIAGVEVVVLLPGPAGTPNHFYLSTSDSFVPAGQTRTIFGLQTSTGFTFSGANEHNGAFKVYGGSGSETITGSDGNDWLFGGNGGDAMTGGAGADTFFYDGVAQSTSLGFDKITGFDDSADTIDLPFAVTGLAAPTSGNLGSASFDVDLSTAFAGLTAHQAGMFTATGGDMSGRAFLVIDADGNAGYQAGSDYVIEIIAPATPIDNPALFV